jgi:hypothetical protein
MPSRKHALRVRLRHIRRFYYVDERWDSGKAPREEMDPVAVGKTHVELAKKTEQGPWLHTFVKDRGYVDFSATDTPWDLSGGLEVFYCSRRLLTFHPSISRYYRTLKLENSNSSLVQ